MLDRRQFLLATAASSIGLVGASNNDKGSSNEKGSSSDIRIRESRTIATLPESISDMKALHDRSRDFSAELLPEGEAFEVKTFAPFLTKRDENEAKKGLPNVSCRRHALSVGLEMTNDDQKQLPLLSREQILSYLKSNYVSVQARIYREPTSRALYLGSRCLAATRAYRKGNLTEGFSPTVAESVNNIRSVGLLLPDRMPPTPANLRTLVSIHKNELSQDGKRSAAPRVNYEYLFIHGKESGPDRLELHAFATSDERTKFHWLKPAETPAIPSDCSVRGSVFFTEYSHQGLYPKSAVIRRSMITGRKSFSWDALEKYSRDKFKEPAMKSITKILVAIIAGDIAETDMMLLPRGSRDALPRAGGR